MLNRNPKVKYTPIQQSVKLPDKIPDDKKSLIKSKKMWIVVLLGLIYLSQISDATHLTFSRIFSRMNSSQHVRKKATTLISNSSVYTYRDSLICSA